MTLLSKIQQKQALVGIIGLGYVGYRWYLDFVRWNTEYWALTQIISRWNPLIGENATKNT